jgi:predicted nucleotidyltransferase
MKSVKERSASYRVSTSPAPTAARKRKVGLADTLFSRTQQKVLALLFGQPDRSFYTKEIIEQAQGGSGAIQRELARLTDSGLVSAKLIGNQRHYQARRDSPIFEELAAIVRKTVGLAEPLRASLQPLERHIVAAFVYGSVAKGNDTARSDIDLMVVSDKLDYADLIVALEPAQGALGRQINPTLYSTKEFRQRRGVTAAFVQRVMEQPKVWLIGNEDALGT